MATKCPRCKGLVVYQPPTSLQEGAHRCFICGWTKMDPLEVAMPEFPNDMQLQQENRIRKLATQQGLAAKKLELRRQLAQVICQERGPR